MQRHEMMTAMTELGLKGMAGAFDEAVTTGLQRKRTTMEVLTDLLRAEATHRHAASVRYRMSAARLPAVKDLDAFVFDDTPINEGLVRSLWHMVSRLHDRRCRTAWSWRRTLNLLDGRKLGRCERCHRDSVGRAGSE